MFWHVYARASQCPELQAVYLATDDTRILEKAEEFNIPAICTSSQHRSGTERVLEAARELELAKDSLVLNIQGDEPLLHPEMLSKLARAFTRDQIQVCTLANSISFKEANKSSVVKVVCNDQGQALYFSRSLIPHAAAGGEQTFLGHIGIYAYRMHILQEFVRLGPSTLEQTEKLEQLRLLQAGIPIQIVLTRHRSQGVDLPEDIHYIESLMEEQQRCRRF